MTDQLAVLAELKKAYKGEAMFRPSSIGRSIVCPGSVRLIAEAFKAGYKRSSSKFALEGSAAHVVAEQALRGIRQPDEWTDRMVQLDDGGGMLGHFVDEEMTDCIEGYKDEVLSGLTNQDELFIEHRMSLAALDPSDPILGENRGTGDAVIINRATRRAKVKDLKYGKGVKVNAKTPQLRNYSVLTVLAFPDAHIQEVEMTIFQPRLLNEADRRTSVTFSTADLMMDFLGELLQTFHNALSPDPALKTGSHCRWCPAKDMNMCPAIQAEAVNIGRDAFSVMPAHTASSMMGPIPTQVFVGTLEEPRPRIAVPPGAVTLPPVLGLSPSDIATVLERRELFDIWIKSIEQRACALIEAGVTVPGWMMSARAGHRKWKGEPAVVEASLREIGVKIIEMYSVPKMLSPAQIEKKLKPAMRGLIEPMVERPMGEPQLMRATEGRVPIGGGMGPIPT